MNNQIILDVENFSVGFGKKNPLQITDGVSFKLRRGSITALVGESGCGKSLTCLALTRLLAPGAVIMSGSVKFFHTEFFQILLTNREKWFILLWCKGVEEEK